ncbi:hypothetical protein EBU99_00660 [bacterium]|nr:hypothetical protein [bacterium]
MTKPRKPLRGLFASTEAPVSTPPRPAAVPVPPPRKETPTRPQAPLKPKTPPERLAPPPRIKPAVPLMMKEMEQPSVAVAAIEPEVVVAVSVAPLQVAEPVSIPLENPTSPIADDRIMTLQYNFEAMRSMRDAWAEADYARFLKRLDAVQTEAFLLRGKLLSEAKTRFFETNKIGWAEFCEMRLGMNYTTANQYIRVASEFDVTSHQRPDFGFEHFKALLPLPVEERAALIETIDSISVKSLRQMVKMHLISKTPSPVEVTPRETLRHSSRLIKMLQQVKGEIAAHGGSFQALNQNQRWQMSAACQNIAAHLNQLARALNEEPNLDDGRRGSHLRAGAFATAEGVAAMQEILPIQESTDSSN